MNKNNSWTISGCLIFFILATLAALLIKIRTGYVRQTLADTLISQVQSDVVLVKDYLVAEPEEKTLNLQFTQIHDFYVFINAYNDEPYIVYSGALTSPYDVILYQNGMITELKSEKIDKSRAALLADIYRKRSAKTSP